MKIKDVNELRVKGFETCEKEQLLDAYTIVNASKNSLSTIEKEIKEALEPKIESGEQLVLDFGTNTFTASLVSTDELSFDCDDEDLYSICSSTSYCTHGVDKAAIKKAYVKGILDPAIASHIVVTKQQEMKISKKARKEVK